MLHGLVADADTPGPRSLGRPVQRLCAASEVPITEELLAGWRHPLDKACLGHSKTVDRELM
jgi:hypothetical protein